MQPVLFLNPRTRRRRRFYANRRRAHRRRANPRRSHRRHTYRARARNPRRRRRHLFRNMRRRYRARARNPRRRRYRNPRSGGFTPGRGSVFSNYVVPATIGAVGAVGFDIAWGYVSPQLPATFQSGWASTIVELGAIWLLLEGVRRMSPRNYGTAAKAAAGAATVVAYKAVQGVAAQMLPSTTPGLSGYMPGMRYSLGALGRTRAPRRLRGLGDVYSPAAVIQQPPVRQFGQLGAYMGTGGVTVIPGDPM
jgi:hypothetical protein